MAVTYATIVKENRLKNVNDAINSKTYVVGSGAGSAGTLVIGTASMATVLATITLQNPAGVASGTAFTISGVPLSSTATGTGTAAAAEFRNNAGTVVVSGLTVGTSGTDITINSASITTGQTVQLTSGVINHG
ncbi:hypothetical protein UFOVP470_8 [uncultured Caudovirales phage]|jgi:polyisoprenoid-binding protein YceI|uniref:Uncharacterized protein n=1 Tax=uncultured Caudovirales phage TaxID=2100421 RepID=A0A6J5MF93_9CAUD|nr:hypothetical protein UFOVP470_8 [uncultured Caudovirales phage]